jgi:MFS transporter, MHS family, shikimate and dehydroshikimate transport protein
MQQQAGNRRKIALATLIGSTIEWYDFFIYGIAAALVFNEVFFPQFSAGRGLLLSFATFGVSFVARPFGGLVAGQLGDSIGR